jgi:hypothetical protein
VPAEAAVVDPLKIYGVENLQEIFHENQEKSTAD